MVYFSADCIGDDLLNTFVIFGDDPDQSGSRISLLSSRCCCIEAVMIDEYRALYNGVFTEFDWKHLGRLIKADYGIDTLTEILSNLDSRLRLTK